MLAKFVVNLERSDTLLPPPCKVTDDDGEEPGSEPDGDDDAEESNAGDESEVGDGAEAANAGDEPGAPSQLPALTGKLLEYVADDEKWVTFIQCATREKKGAKKGQILEGEDGDYFRIVQKWHKSDLEDDEEEE